MALTTVCLRSSLRSYHGFIFCQTSEIMAIRASKGTRKSRLVTPYEGNTSRGANAESETNSDTPHRKHISSIKFLLPNLLAGVLIGSGGALIRELMETTQAEVHVSDARDLHPGTNFRTIYITGDEPAVNLAQSLVWEMIGQQTFAENEGKKALAWHPNVAKASPGEYDEIEVEGKITIPAHAGGMIIGKAGATIRSLGEESKIDVSINDKGEAEVTQERIITMKGKVEGCMNCTHLILQKLATLEDDYYYVFNRTSYTGFGRKERELSKQSRLEGRGLVGIGIHRIGELGSVRRGSVSSLGGGSQQGNSSEMDDEHTPLRNILNSALSTARGRGETNNNNTTTTNNASATRRSPRERGGNGSAGGGHLRYINMDVSSNDEHHLATSHSLSTSRTGGGGGGGLMMGGYDSNGVRRALTSASPRGSSGVGAIHSHNYDYGVTNGLSIPIETINALTTIDLSIPDKALGIILGPQGSRVAEIESMSGATIRVSRRGEFIGDTNNRLLSITGPPVCAQTAHTLIIHKLRTSGEF